jgi:AraC family transcriptional regulator
MNSIAVPIGAPHAALAAPCVATLVGADTPIGPPARRADGPVLHAHHIRRMEQVLDFVDLNLAGDLSLDCLASRAAISPFHFHRLFHAWTGETVKEFVRRRRLETAAGRLRHCRDERVTDVSLGCGFASSEAFARAFREHFGMTPTQWRHGGWVNWRVPANDAWAGAPFRIDVKRHEAIEVLYLRERGDYALSAKPLWTKFLAWTEALDVTDQPLLSMGVDDPAITAPDRCRLDACVQVPPGWVDPGLRPLRRTVPGGLYASLHYTGPARHIGHGWDALLNGWLPQSPYALGDGQFFERYDRQVSIPADDWVDCALRMPVRVRVS